MLSSMSAAIKISREFTSKLDFPFKEALEDYEYNIQFFDCIRNKTKNLAQKLMATHFDRSRLLVERYKNMNL